MRWSYDQIGMKIMPYISLFLDNVDKDIDLASGQKKVIFTPPPVAKVPLSP